MKTMLLIALLAGVVLAGCGDDEDGGATAAARADAKAGAYPVTIPSRFGKTTIPEAPKRVVALDFQSTDAALALGVVPVGAGKVTYVGGGIQEWTRRALRGKPTPQLINTDAGIPYEQVAALRPDLILANHTYALDDKAYERLRRIAPTVHFAKDPLIDTWQESTRRIGQALGRQQRAGTLVEQTEGAVAAVRRRTPAFEGKTVNIFNAQGGLYTISDPADQSVRFLSELGMRLDPDVAALGDSGQGEGGRTVLSRERYAVLDCDVLLGTSGGSPHELAELSDDTLFKRLDAVREKRYVGLTIGDGTSMAFPSLLSVRFATREVVPRLEQAVAGTS